MSKVEVEHCPALIGGERVLPQEMFEDLDPSTGCPCAEVARCRAAEVDQAVAVARQTFERTWRHTTPAERARILRRIADLVRRDKEDIARLESTDTGKPLRQARVDADVAARYFEFYADTPHLAWTLDIIRDIARDEHLSFRLAAFSADISKPTLPPRCTPRTAVSAARAAPLHNPA